MPQIGYSIFIDAPPPVIWEVLTDVSGFPRWMQGIKAAQLVDGASLRRGAHMQARGRGGTYLFELLDLQDERLVAWQFRFRYPSIFRLIQAYGLQPTTGRTRVTLVEIYGGVVGFTMRFLVGRWFRRQILSTLNRLRDTAEAIHGV